MICVGRGGGVGSQGTNNNIYTQFDNSIHCTIDFIVLTL